MNDKLAVILGFLITLIMYGIWAVTASKNEIAEEDRERRALRERKAARCKKYKYHRCRFKIKGYAE